MVDYVIPHAPNPLHAVIPLCRAWCVRGLRGGRGPAQCLGMMHSTGLTSVQSNELVPFTEQPRLAVAAYLARVTGPSRTHTGSELCCYLAWRAERGLDPLAAGVRSWNCPSGGCKRLDANRPGDDLSANHPLSVCV
jgi:hypothetical protein